jgi:hypothetical protein
MYAVAYERNASRAYVGLFNVHKFIIGPCMAVRGPWRAAWVDSREYMIRDWLANLLTCSLHNVHKFIIGPYGISL